MTGRGESVQRQAQGLLCSDRQEAGKLAFVVMMKTPVRATFSEFLNYASQNVRH